MRILHNGPLALVLDISGPSNQCSHCTRLGLTLSHDDNGLTLGQLATPAPFGIDALLQLVALFHPAGGALDGEAAARRRQTRGHKCGAGEHEADGAAVDSNGGKRLGETVDEAQVRNKGGRILLVEERRRVENVQRVAVGQLHALEGGLLGHDFVNVRRQERVCREEGLAKRSLHRRLELLLRRRGESRMQNERG